MSKVSIVEFEAEVVNFQLAFGAEAVNSVLGNWRATPMTQRQAALDAMNNHMLSFAEPAKEEAPKPRTKKVEAVVEEAVDPVVEEAVAELEQEEATKSIPTERDLKDALIAHARGGADKKKQAKDLLGEYGAAKAADVPEDKRQEIIDKLAAL